MRKKNILYNISSNRKDHIRTLHMQTHWIMLFPCLIIIAPSLLNSEVDKIIQNTIIYHLCPDLQDPMWKNYPKSIQAVSSLTCVRDGAGSAPLSAHRCWSRTRYRETGTRLQGRERGVQAPFKGELSTPEEFLQRCWGIPRSTTGFPRVILSPPPVLPPPYKIPWFDLI